VPSRKNKKMRRNVSLSIDIKYQIITAIDAGKKRDTAGEFGVLPNTLSTILKNRDKIVNAYHSSDFTQDHKKIRASEHKEVEDALHTWFKSARNDNIPLSGPILAAKAEKLCAKLGNENFTVSHLWVERFKICWNIVSKSICGESGSLDSAVVDDYIASKFPALLKDYEQMLAVKGENYHGGKHSKECITQVTKPRHFKNVKSLPVDYKANTRKWMTSDIFIEWVKNFDRKMEYQKHKVLLFIDNCPVHPTIATLKATTVIFLPPNSTSKLQPIDQGIIKSYKQNFRCLLLQHIIACFELWENSEVNLLQDIQFAHRPWSKVTMRYISSCFAKAGFHTNETNDETENPSSDEEDNILLSELVESWKTVQVHMELSSDLTVEDYVDMAKNIIDGAQLTEADIVAAIKTKESESDEEYEPEEPKLPPVAEVTHSLEILNRFINALSEVSYMTYNNIAKLFDYILSHKADNIKQTKITD
uniref:HTH CENPB-type domain-containing protein n=1 Tax=Latimeria chalumnae TaxID=7897 RepID=H3AUS4_LATCH